MLKRQIPALGLCGILLLVGCEADDRLVTPTGPPARDISDAAHAGPNPHFYWLPPIVAAPSPTGTFDGSLQPEVAICKWNETDAECGPDLGIFNSETGPGSETVRVVAEDEHYIVNWHTNEILNDFPLDVGETYRIYVRVGAQSLGHADVIPVANAQEMKNVDTDEYIPLVAGMTLAIKFRIEEGALTAANAWVSAGSYHSCAVRTDGQAYCWGYNYSGQLGLGTFSPLISTTELPVTGEHTFQSVTAGYDTTCGLTTGGEIYCWGYGGYGQLGNGTYTYRQPTPLLVQAPVGVSFQSVQVGYRHVCALSTEGQAYCWGYNFNGQVGTGAFGPGTFNTPQPVDGGHTFRSVRPGWFHSCGVTTGDDAYCWGHNYQGQLGIGEFTTTFPFGYASPQLLGSGYRSVSAGGYHTCGVTTTDDAHCWGYNIYGQLGIGEFTTSPPDGYATPQLVASGYRSVSAGLYHNCGVTTGDDAYCWGYNYYGQLGIGVFTKSNPFGYATPQLAGAGYRSVSAGFRHSCGVTTGDEAFCWGRNSLGQLGDGSRVDKSVPGYTMDLAAPLP